MLGQNPWGDRIPLSLGAVIPRHEEQQWWLMDVHNQVLPITAGIDQPWLLLAMSGGHPCTVFGEWNGLTFFPLSVWTQTPGQDPQFSTLGES